MNELKKLRRRLRNLNYKINENNRRLRTMNGLVRRQIELASHRSDCHKMIARLTLAKSMNDQDQLGVLRVMTKDICGAKRNDWDNCPIARAMKRLFPGNDVQVFDENLLINGTSFKHTDDTFEYAKGWNEGPMRTATLNLPDGIGDALRSETNPKIVVDAKPEEA